jgi:hypothetical protein
VINQRALKELFVYANKHIAEAQFASSPFPEDMFMLAILLEMHKEVMGMEKAIGGPLRNGEEVGHEDWNES